MVVNMFLFVCLFFVLLLFNNVIIHRLKKYCLYHKLYFIFSQNISYHVKRVTKILPTLAAQVLYPGNITPGETEIWSGGQLLIPSDLPPSHLPGCQIMNIHYSLQVMDLCDSLGL